MQMPVLNPQFFHDHAPSMEFFHKWKSQGPWSPQIIPISSWDGILFIAVSADDTPTLAIPHVFVKAEAESLSAVWNRWHEIQDSLAETVVFTKAAASPDFELDLENSLLDDVAPAAEPKVSENLEIPDGMGDLALPEEEKPAAINSSTDRGLEMPEGFAETPPMSEDTPIPVSISKPSAAASSAELEVGDILEKLSAHFRHSMILLVNGTNAKPWKWSSGFSAQEKSMTFDISQPSPLRVVYQTHSSYYGPVTPSPFIEQFAQIWLQGKVPSELSIMPVLQQEKLVGIILCSGNPEPDSLEPLKILKNAGQEISLRINNHKNFQAA